MKQDNQSSYHYYRIVSVKKIDNWFFEKHDLRRTHARIYETVILPMFGISENTFLDYRYTSDSLLEPYPQAAYIEFPLWLSAMQVRYMTLCEANKFSLWLCYLFDDAFRTALRQSPGCRVSAATLETCVQRSIEHGMAIWAR